jgi:signal transduction histidine kinase
MNFELQPPPDAGIAPPSAPALSAAELAAAAEPINILIVDDEPKNLTALETVLDDPSYRLVRAVSADQALLALVAEEFALLVLDIQMPVMNGFELAQMVKQRKKTANVPIIFLTAYYSEDQHVLEGYSTGAVDYLHKPINATVLRSKVAVFAQLHRKTRESALANTALLAEVSERREAQKQLRDLNQELEQRVAARTAALVKSEEAMREADKRKDEFLAMLGHELRNPLSAIRHAVRIHGESPEDPAARHWASEVIDRQSTQLTRMVDDLLDVERINRGRVELRPEVLELNAVLARAVEAAQALMAAKRHQLTVDAEPALPVRGDAARLQQVFVNLLSNAAKYTSEGGRIRVSARRRGDEAIVSVSDNGIGLTPDVLPRVFDLFTQVHTSIDRAQGGLGIGLTVVKSLVEMHGGTIVAQSDGVDRGSTFTIRLPLAANAGHKGVRTSGSVAPVAGPPPADPATIRVLIVDDHRDAGDALARLLTRRGCQVCVAHDGLEGVDVARQFHPTVLLLDLGLPGLDGYELCRTLRAQEEFKSARFIAISGYAQKSDIELSRSAGFDAHFAKPVEFAELFAELQAPAGARA